MKMFFLYKSAIGYLAAPLKKQLASINDHDDKMEKIHGKSSDPQEVVNLCRITRERGGNVIDMIESLGLSVARSFPELNSRPLFFIHIPKTAGASVNQYLESQFDDAEVCPGWNPPDLTRIGDKAKTFKLFRGHFIAGQVRLAPPQTELFTILRDPANQAYSLYKWLRRLNKNYWKDAEAAAKGRNTRLITSTGKSERRHAELGMKFARTLQFPAYQKSNKKFMHLFSENLIAFYLSDTGTSNFQSICRQRHSRTKLLSTSQKHLNRCIACGVFELLSQSIKVLCWKRGWPAPTDLPRIHSFREKQIFRAIDRHTRRLIKENSRIDSRLYARAKTKLDLDWARLEAAATGQVFVSKYLDEQHREQFFASTKTRVGLDLTADAAWPGIGWGLRERNEHGQVWKWLGQSGQSTLFAKLALDFDYLLSAFIYTATNESLASLEALSMGKSLQLIDASPEGMYTTRRWFLPRETLAQCKGLVDLDFRFKHPSDTNRIALSRIVIHPWQG